MNRSLWRHLPTSTQERAWLTLAVCIVVILLDTLVFQHSQTKALELLTRKLHRQAHQIQRLSAAVDEQMTPPRQYKHQNLQQVLQTTAEPISLVYSVQEAHDERVTITMEQANYLSVMHWITQLRYEHGVQATMLKLEKTESPGEVAVQLTLAQAR